MLSRLALSGHRAGSLTVAFFAIAALVAAVTAPLRSPCLRGTPGRGRSDFWGPDPMRRRAATVDARHTMPGDLPLSVST
jgi:hypothetical protein